MSNRPDTETNRLENAIRTADRNRTRLMSIAATQRSRLGAVQPVIAADLKRCENQIHMLQRQWAKAVTRPNAFTSAERNWHRARNDGKE